MTEPPGAGPVIVGVHPGQAAAVTREAARLAVALGRDLVCAYVTEDSYLTEWDRADVREEASLHPGDVAADDERIALDLAAAIGSALDPAPGGGQGTVAPDWSLRILAGDAAKALGRIAVELDARLIVVGTRGRGVEHALEEWLGGSVAAHLAHDQPRPVLVVPLHVAGHGDDRDVLAPPA
ncbi:universal stress protein [Leifsonia shinshuensis]|uniref:Universal stress protein n=1 Tax=Leifsonia shinshuensis TaxID=150026 RepID=A0A7G6Y738_9MICO|nr:universal stress protein [Leifsonia shinshuensis]QNE34303.1 universal stress protein [Leifsonia shinshuensis]